MNASEPSQTSSPPRLVHPMLGIVALGGVLGSAVNLGATAALFYFHGVNPYISFFVGTLLNELFHHVYYGLVFANREVTARTPLLLRFLTYVAVAIAAMGVLWVFFGLLHLHLVVAVVASIAVLSIANLLIVRIATFSSARIAEIEYRQMHETFYDDQTDASKVGWFRAWFHLSRFKRLHRFVMEHYRPGLRIADLGCGNCWWNIDKVPVIGVDINENMMRWAKQQGRLAEYHVRADLGDTGLAEKSADVVIMSETLEHLYGHERVLREVRRILSDEGVFLVTVPYDYFLGPFFILFNVNCVYQGWVRGSTYHKFRCGHIHHFTKRRLRAMLEAAGFEVKRLYVVNGLTLYAAAGKRASGQDENSPG